MSLFDYFKKIFWWIFTPLFPIFRSLSKKIGYSPYPPRQQYHLGYLAPRAAVEGFYNFLCQTGFDEDKIAWIDEGEILSLRLRENFKYQWHVRLFEDGEIRGHYELTPEYSPLGHLRDAETSARTEDFKRFLGEWLTLESSRQEKLYATGPRPHYAACPPKDSDANR